MLEEINRMKKILNQLLKTHDLRDKIVIEVSQKLDKLILDYHEKKDKDSKLNIKEEEDIYLIKKVI